MGMEDILDEVSVGATDGAIFFFRSSHGFTAGIAAILGAGVGAGFVEVGLVAVTGPFGGVLVGRVVSEDRFGDVELLVTVVPFRDGEVGIVASCIAG